MPDLKVETIKIQIMMKKEQNLQTVETQALNIPVIIESLLVSDNASTVLKITPFGNNGECMITIEDEHFCDYHYINAEKAKEIIEFLQHGLNSL